MTKLMATKYLMEGNARRPERDQLHRGFILKLELPGHMHPRLHDKGIAERVEANLELGFGFPEGIDHKTLPDLTPFISEVGVAGADGKLAFHPYEALFAKDGSLTPLAKQLDSKMTQLPPGAQPAL